MPRLDFVQQYIQSLDHDPNLPPTTDTEDPELQDTPLWIQRKREAERKIQLNIQNPTLVQALEMEQSCEELEMDMATMIFPFTELARFLESKGGRIKVIPSLLSPNRVPPLEELLRVGTDFSLYIFSSRTNLTHGLLLLEYPVYGRDFDLF
jgi:hypothetical protein